MNNNQTLIDGLRLAADFLESKPEMPVLPRQSIYFRIWDKSALKEAARHLGSFTKVFTDQYFELHKPINEAIDVQAYIAREQVCKKIVTWDCPDDEALLKMVETEAEVESGQ